MASQTGGRLPYQSCLRVAVRFKDLEQGVNQSPTAVHAQFEQVYDIYDYFAERDSSGKREQCEKLTALMYFSALQPWFRTQTLLVPEPLTSLPELVTLAERLLSH